MGLFKKPKYQPQQVNSQLEALQRQQLQASIDSLRNAPQVKMPDPVRLAAPQQSTAADEAAAERMARRNMAKRKGVAYSINPTGLGGAGGTLG